MIDMQKCDLRPFFAQNKKYCIEKVVQFQKKIAIVHKYFEHRYWIGAKFPGLTDNTEIRI